MPYKPRLERSMRTDRDIWEREIQLGEAQVERRIERANNLKAWKEIKERGQEHIARVGMSEDLEA